MDAVQQLDNYFSYTNTIHDNKCFNERLAGKKK